MPFTCSICCDNLESSPEVEDEDAKGEKVLGKRDGAVKISSARCGHVFHDFCIRKWLTHLRLLGQEKHCPCCRTRIGCLKTLYPTTQDRYEDEYENNGVTGMSASKSLFSVNSQKPIHRQWTVPWKSKWSEIFLAGKARKYSCIAFLSSAVFTTISFILFLGIVLN